MTMRNIITNMNIVNRYYVAEIVGKDMKGNPIISRVTGNFAFEGDALEAKQRMSRRDKGNYIVKTV